MMSDTQKLSPEDRALIAWCRTARDWPLAAFAWGNVRGTLYAIALYCVWIVVSLWSGWLMVVPFDVAMARSLVIWYLVVPGIVWLGLSWLATRFLQMAALVDKLCRDAEAEELLRLAADDRR
jgi:hypothetical protein